MTGRDITRRGLLSLPLAAAAIHSAHAAAPYSLPGLYPGRVVSVTHPGASINLKFQAAPIEAIIRRGMMELTGQASIAASWRKLFQPGDVVGIKVNPSSSSVLISSPYCLREVITSLLLAGVGPRDIIVYERFQTLLNSVKGWLPAWVRTSYATPGYYTDDQTSLIGYDAAHFFDMPEHLKPWQSATNPLHTRSHVANFVTREVTKIISLTVLKDHQAAGVTLNLKNLAGGCFNNWNRHHDPPSFGVNIAIPTAVSLPVLRGKVVLGIIDGVHGLCEGGPINQADPKYGFVWPHQTMYFATDIVAADRVGWLAIDAERARRGMLPEALATYSTLGLRQPDHITVASQLGLGEWRDSYIDHRHFVLA